LKSGLSHHHTPKHRRADPQRRFAARLLLIAALMLGADMALPPDMRRVEERSQMVRASDGSILRSYLTPDGMVRLPADAAQLSPRYKALLLAYEDRHFARHGGIYLPALARAAVQWLREGRVISGGSTLTMQVARLLEPRPRTLASKLIELLRAVQLERRYSKQQIFAFYLTLAPFGGNLEGIEAGSRGLLAKPPGALTTAEAAMMVALTQSPTSLRKNLPALRRARNKVLSVAGPRVGLGPDELAESHASALQLRPTPQAFVAPLLADRLRSSASGRNDIRSSIDRRLQSQIERRLAGFRRTLDPRASLAILVVRLRDRQVRAYVGSADFNDNARQGQVDVVQAVRSPGSALKPFIYVRAFDEALAHPMTQVDDVETSFGIYAPANFEDQYHGRVTLADGLRLSLNVPAVILLDRLGPVAFAARMERSGLPLRLPRGARPDLPIALGGVGVRLDDMAAAYAALGDDGVIRPLRFAPDQPVAAERAPIAGPRARALVTDILASAPLPPGVSETAPAAHRIAVKTGTSYGYRDAWAFGYDAQHVVAVWTGRPDGTPSPGRFGLNTAAPILFDIFAMIGSTAPPRPRDVGRDDPLPPALQQIGPAASQQQARALRIAYPVAETVLPFLPGQRVPLEARGGQPPYVWLVNGAPLGAASQAQQIIWQPDGPGFHDLVVLDAGGHGARARVRVTDRMITSGGF
jgi:penicillin-binding protein 1C